MQLNGVETGVEGLGEWFTMSQPSFAEAMAEK
jgi:hypothetical protein